MRRIVAGLFTSLDGVVNAPDRWQEPYMSDEWTEAIGAATERADAVLLGRRTYLEFAELWPKADSDNPMAAFMNDTPKYVASNTLDAPLEWANSSPITGDLTEGVAALKKQPGKDILIPGSPALVGWLLRDGLLDELGLFVLPIVVGSGMHLFEDMTERVRLELVGSDTFSTGVLSVTYRPQGA